MLADPQWEAMDLGGFDDIPIKRSNISDTDRIAIGSAAICGDEYTLYAWRA